MYPNPSSFAIISRYQNTAPVDLEAIARDLSIPINYINLGSDIAGRICRDPQKSPGSGFIIEINASQHKNRQRFTLAHELAHYILHRDLIEAGITDDVMYRSSMGGHLETQANQVAADIIMPIDLVKQRFQSQKSAELLAKEFGVSRAAMDIRLERVRSYVSEMP